MNTPLTSCATLALTCILLVHSTAASTLEWIDQIGTNAHDYGNAVSADGLGNVYITGLTEGTLGDTSAGGRDAFVSKYDADGTLLWTEQLGSSNADYGYGVSADGLGNVYLSGQTDGSLEGNSTVSPDAFVSKYDASGTLLWTEQLGTRSTERSLGVSADGLGNVYIAGSTLASPSVNNFDAFVRKYDADGTLLWTEQFGTSSADVSSGVSADSLGNVYISGSTGGSLGGSNSGSHDVFVSKYDASGTLLWTEQFGSSSGEGSSGISTDGLGNVYISGQTGGSLEGINAGFYDAFIAKYSDPVPEPSSLLLAALATVGLLLRWKRAS